MDEIQRLRERIDEIDQELTLLIKSRYENARLLGRIKQARGLSLLDPEREETILRKVERLSVRLRLDPGILEQIFQKIFTLSVMAQYNTRSGQPSNLNGLRLLVVGGTGRMGLFIARFASLRGAHVIIAGRSISNTKKSAREIEVEPGTILNAAESDIVIISVPIEETERVAVETASLMKEGSLLSDVSSVKTGVSDRIAMRTSAKIEYVSIHPLFAPNIDHLYDQNIAAIPYRPGPMWGRLDQAFRTSGADIHKMTATQHDRKMAYVQGLHHFSLMTLGIGLSDMGGEPLTRSLRDTETRIFRMVENWETVRAIQLMNPFVSKTRRSLVEVSESLGAMRSRDVSLAKKRLLSNVQKWSRKR
jgi:prephenate dehydrogenase/chorismate mutase